MMSFWGPDLGKALKVTVFCPAPPSSAGLASKIPLLILMDEGGRGSLLAVHKDVPSCKPNVLHARQARTVCLHPAQTLLKQARGMKRRKH